MFLFRAVWWLLTLPFRVVGWTVGLLLWVALLPFQLVFGVLRLFGVGRLVPLALSAGALYFLYRLVSDPPVELSHTETAPLPRNRVPA